MIVERRNGDQVCLSQHSHNKETLKKLSAFRKERVLCDVTIIVEGKRFPAHKNVLAAGSQYFNAMFTTQMTEASQSEITLESLRSDVFEQVLDYFYEGNLTIDMTSVADMLHASSLLLLKDIEIECFHYLKKNLNLKNCVHIQSIGEIYSNKDLIKKTNEYLIKNFQKLAQESDVSNFSLKDLKTLLKSEDLMCKSEDAIAYVVNTWLLARPVDVTSTDLTALLKTVRIPALTKDGMTILTSTVKELDRKNNCKDFEEALNAEVKIQNRSQRRCGVRYRVAHANEHVLFCAGRYGDCYGYSMSSNKFRKLETYPEMKQPSDIIVDGHMVYAVGSSSIFSQNCSFVLYAYDTRENKWTHLPSMKKARYMQCSVVLDSKLYVIGGRNIDSSDTTISHSVECYDTMEKTWTSRTSTLSSRVVSCAVATKKYIYVMGGSANPPDDQQGVNTVERYCPLKDEWTQAPSLTTKRYSSSAVYFHDKIYVFGGRNLVELHTFEYLEANGKQWVQVAFPYATPICSALTIDDKILALGHSFWGDDLVLQYYAQRRRGHWQKVNNFIHTSHRNKSFKYASIQLLNYDFENRQNGSCDCHDGDSSDGEDYITDSSDIMDSDEDRMLMEFAPWGLWV